MKNTIYSCALLLLSFGLCAEAPTPEQLAQQQLVAYNARDIDAFLIPFADDVEVYNFPNELLYKGKEKMRAKYEGMFKRLVNLHCEVVNRIVFGDTVVDQEVVKGFGTDKPLEAMAIYKISDHKISKVYFLRKDK
jgi:hypothetical protein